MKRSREEALEVSYRLKQHEFSKTLKEAIELLSELGNKEFLKRDDVRQFWADFHGEYWEQE